MPDQHHTKEWALIAPINGGIADDKHMVQLESRHEVEQVAVWNKEIFIAGLATQPYGTGLGKFSSRFKPDEPYVATIAIEKGTHGEHGTAIFFEQGTRRSLLTRRLYDISDDDALWYVMKDWAQFKPRLSKPRSDPGLLYYPAEYTHVFEKYWDVLNDPTMHPDGVESSHSFDSMKAMAEALAPMVLDSWEPQPDSVAPEKSQRIARTAALSQQATKSPRLTTKETPGQTAGQTPGQSAGQSARQTPGPTSVENDSAPLALEAGFSVLVVLSGIVVLVILFRKKSPTRGRD
jgi:hypothetical protein